MTIAALTWSSHADAQEFDAENFVAASPGDAELLSTSSARVVPDGSFAVGLTLGVSDDSLVVVDADDENRLASVIDTRVGAELAAVYGLGRFEVGFALPMVMHQSATLEATDMQPVGESAGLGDLRLTARGRLASHATSGIALGAALSVAVPTSVSAELAGDDGPSGRGLLVGEWRRDRVLVAVNAGARVRESHSIGDLDVGSALLYGLGASVQLGAGLSVVGELGGETSGSRMEESPLEVRGGARWWISGDVGVAAAYGRGLVPGYGSPDHRGVFTLTYRPATPEPPPPTQVKVVVERREAPPLPDPDGDGIRGSDDQCPEEPEDFDGFSDADGCPDSDNDGDGIADADDKCANDAEDADGWRDDDGCPDPDNDFDGLADGADACPDEAEVINGIDDDDGCPDQGRQLVTITADQLVIDEKIHFAYDKDVILPKSEPLLEQLAKTLARNPWIRKVRIEGHTDNKGGDEYNMDLSQRRADAVRAALIRLEIAADRLTAQGRGETSPIDDNDTSDGRAANRRVEFWIVDADEQAAPEEVQR